jgi:hypothetical protein
MKMGIWQGPSTTNCSNAVQATPVSFVCFIPENIAIVQMHLMTLLLPYLIFRLALQQISQKSLWKNKGK